jgi:MFS family permease
LFAVTVSVPENAVASQYRRILAIAVLSAAAVFGLRPLATYRAVEMGASNFDVGLIASAFALLAIGAAIFVGRAVDRRGERGVILAGCTCMVAGAGLVAVAPSTLMLAASQAILGLGQLMVVVGSHAFFAVRGAGEERDTRVGMYSSAASIGQFIGPATAGLLAESVLFGDGQLTFIGIAALVLGASAIVAVGLPRGPGHAPAVAQAGPASIRTTFAQPVIRRALIASTALLVGVDLMVAYLPVFGIERGYSPAIVGLMLGSLGISQLVSRLFLGSLIRRLGHLRLLLVAMGVPALLIPLLTIVGFWPLLVLVMVGVGLALGLGQPMTIAMIANAAASGSQGLAMSMRMAGNRLGQLTVPAVVGGAAGHAGAGAIFWSTAGILAVSCLILGRNLRGTVRETAR